MASLLNDHLWELELWTFERRNKADLLELFRIYKGQSFIRFGDMFIEAGTGTRGHSAKIYKNRCR